MPLHMQRPASCAARTRRRRCRSARSARTRHGVNVRDLAARFEAGAEVTPEALLAARVLRTLRHPVKMLGDGELEVALTVTRTASRPRRAQKIEAAGGTVVVIGGEDVRPSPCATPVKRAGRRGARRRAPAEAAVDDDEAERAARGRRRGRRAGRRATSAEGDEASMLDRAARTSWRVPELRNRLLFTACIIALYRAGSCLPTPGVQTDVAPALLRRRRNGTILSVLNLFSGGALANLSLFALGIMPYITASIILQLMTVGRPVAREAPEGGRGRLQEDHAVHALPHGRARGAPVGRLRVPVPQRLGDRRERPAAEPHGRPLHPDRDDAHGGHRRCSCGWAS